MKTQRINSPGAWKRKDPNDKQVEPRIQQIVLYTVSYCMQMDKKEPSLHNMELQATLMLFR